VASWDVSFLIKLAARYFSEVAGSVDTADEGSLAEF